METKLKEEGETKEVFPLSELFEEYKNVVIITILFFITILGLVMNNNRYIEKLNVELEAKQEILSGALAEAEQANIRIAEAEAPTIYLNQLIDERTNYKLTIEQLKQSLELAEDGVSITENKIRCQRVALYDSELDCEQEADYNKFILEDVKY